jgi:large subunit ribosomal protein L6
MLKNEVEVPENIEVSFVDDKLTVKGEKGSITKEFKHPQVKMKVEGKKIIITSEIEKRKAKAVIGTWSAILKNMFIGVTKGWKGELKIVYSHFPIKAKVEGQTLFIENFLGERSPRKVLLPKDVKVEINQNTILVSGIDKELVGNTCGKIELATKIKGYDKRVFQDGVYTTKKPYVEGEDGKS